MRSKGAVIFLLAILFTGGGLLAWQEDWFAAFGETKEKASLVRVDSAPAGAAEAGAAATVTPEAASQDKALKVTGSLLSDEKSEVASTTNGIVKEVLVDRGSLVEKGAVLAVIDSRDADNMLAEGRASIEELRAALGWDDPKRPYQVEEHPGVRGAQAALDLAQSNLDRVQGLFKQGAVSKLAYDQAKTQFETAKEQRHQALHQAEQLYKSYSVAQARLKSLEKAVADTTITAPFSGWVAEKYVSTGERVTTSPMGAGAKIVSLVKLDPLRLALTVPQQFAGLVTQGQQVKFTVDGFPDKTFHGEVKFIGPSMESSSRSLTVEAIVANPGQELRPGLFASAELVLPGKEDRFVIPASAVVTSDEVTRVYTLRDGKVVEKVVAVEEQKDGRAYIKSGLAADDAVITAPDTLAKTGEVK